MRNIEDLKPGDTCVALTFYKEVRLKFVKFVEQTEPSLLTYGEFVDLDKNKYVLGVDTHSAFQIYKNAHDPDDLTTIFALFTDKKMYDFWMQDRGKPLYCYGDGDPVWFVSAKKGMLYHIEWVTPNVGIGEHIDRYFNFHDPLSNKDVNLPQDPEHSNNLCGIQVFNNACEQFPFEKDFDPRVVEAFNGDGIFAICKDHEDAISLLSHILEDQLKVTYSEKENEYSSQRTKALLKIFNKLNK
jgi:hypothetical protein